MTPCIIIVQSTQQLNLWLRNQSLGFLVIEVLNVFKTLRRLKNLGIPVLRTLHILVFLDTKFRIYSKFRIQSNIYDAAFLPK